MCYSLKDEFMGILEMNYWRLEMNYWILEMDHWRLEMDH
jgi:hypothetical protein